MGPTGGWDPSVVNVAAMGALAAIIAGLIQFIGTRSQTAFIERIQTELGAERAERVRLSVRVDTLENERVSLRDAIDERDSRIVVVTNWGMFAAEPPPRTPPPWRPLSPEREH